MLPIVGDFVKHFEPDDADSDLMNKTNIALLKSSNYRYITGAGTKNETD